jgi:hypothetical protein
MLQTLKRMQEAEGDKGLGFEAGLGFDDSDMEDDGEGFQMSEETLRRLSEKGGRAWPSCTHICLIFAVFL